MKIKTMPCQNCNGTGRIVDPRSFGASLRASRERVGLTLREMARRLSLSPPFVSDVEQGRRSFSEQNLEKYQTVIDKELAKL